MGENYCFARSSPREQQFTELLHLIVQIPLTKVPMPIKTPPFWGGVFVGGVRGICLHFLPYGRKLLFRSVKPSRATVHRTVAFDCSNPSHKSPNANKDTTLLGWCLCWRSERDLFAFSPLWEKIIVSLGQALASNSSPNCCI